LGITPISLCVGGFATYHWKALDKGYNVALDFMSSEGLHTKLWGPKVVGDPTLKILKLSLESPKTK